MPLALKSRIVMYLSAEQQEKKQKHTTCNEDYL